MEHFLDWTTALAVDNVFKFFVLVTAVLLLAALVSRGLSSRYLINASKKHNAADTALSGGDNTLASIRRNEAKSLALTGFILGVVIPAAVVVCWLVLFFGLIWG